MRKIYENSSGVNYNTKTSLIMKTENKLDMNSIDFEKMKFQLLTKIPWEKTGSCSCLKMPSILILLLNTLNIIMPNINNEIEKESKQ